MRSSSALANLFERAGFRLVRSGRHLIWRCPCGHAQLTTPATPGKGRSIQNSAGDLARALKVCEQNMKEAA